MDQLRENYGQLKALRSKLLESPANGIGVTRTIVDKEELAEAFRNHWQIHEELKQQLAEELQRGSQGEESAIKLTTRVSLQGAADSATNGRSGRNQEIECESSELQSHVRAARLDASDVKNHMSTQHALVQAQEYHVAQLKSEYRALKEELAMKHQIISSSRKVISRLQQQMADREKSESAVVEALRSELAECRRTPRSPARSKQFPPLLPDGTKAQTNPVALGLNRAASLPPRLIPRTEHLLSPIKYVRLPKAALADGVDARTPSTSGSFAAPRRGRHSQSPTNCSLYSSRSCSRSASPATYGSFDRRGLFHNSPSPSPSWGSPRSTPRSTPRSVPAFVNNLTPRSHVFSGAVPVFRGELLKVNPHSLGAFGALPRVIDARLLNQAFVKHCEDE